MSQIVDLISFCNLLQLVALRSAKVLNISELARNAKLNVVTTSRHLLLIKASFILSRIQPYLINKSSRLIKSPKLYLSDTGIAAYLQGLKESELSEIIKGMLLESYVSQNLAGILSAHYPDSRIAYWNVQGRYEVDFIIEIGRHTIAIEVKSGSRWKEKNLQGLKTYLSGDKNCSGGLLAYNGSDVLKIDKNIQAVSIGLLLRI